MIKKNIKKGLISQEVPYQCQSQWIQMQDMSSNKQKIYPYKKQQKQRYNQKQKQYKYTKLSNQQQFNTKQIKYRQQTKQHDTFNPNIIKMNGQVYKKIDNKDKEIKKKKSNIPHMHVSCRYCDTLQSVQGTTDHYQCCACHKINKCTPAYKIFRCYSCQTKVLYACGISNIIRCTKCGVINSIPNIQNTNPYQINKQPIQVSQQDRSQRFQRQTDVRPYQIISDQRSQILLDQENYFNNKEVNYYPEI